MYFAAQLSIEKYQIKSAEDPTRPWPPPGGWLQDSHARKPGGARDDMQVSSSVKVIATETPLPWKQKQKSLMLLLVFFHVSGFYQPSCQVS